MKKIVIFFSLLVMQYLQAQKFEEYFEDASLRIDFLLLGTDKEAEAIITNLKKEPFFAGSNKNLIYPDYGNYWLEVKNTDNQEVIFAKGFSPLFKEWQHTPEAKIKKSAFENVLQVPFPKKEIFVEIFKKNWNGQKESILKQKISPSDYNIIKETPTKYEISILQKNKSPKQAIDVAIIAEGYTAEEMQKFHSDAEIFIQEMFSFSPFKENKEKFNFYAIKSISEESGTDQGGEKIYKNTILNTNFYTFGTSRYLTCPSLFKLADIAASVPYDQIFVIVNSKEYGGGGFYNVINLVSSDNEFSKEVFVHEFAHGFVGLADEYYDDSAGMQEVYNLNIEPWEENITTLVDFSKKWKNKVETKTPIPTPRIPKYQNKIGAFEGGGYSPKGIYSPMQNCLMKTIETDKFCPICSQAIQKMIDFYTK